MTSALLALAGGASAMSQVSLLPGWVMEDGSRMAGIRITLEPGWKTYWRAPDGNGIPPQFDWTGSENVKAATIHWPQPIIIESYGERTLGYENEVVFPVRLAPVQPGAPLKVELSMFYGVCDEVCIPAEADIELDLPPGAVGGAGAIRAALDTQPISGRAAGINHHECRLRPGGDGFDLTATLHYARPPQLPEMVVIESGDEDVWISPRAVTASGEDLRIEAIMDHFGDGAFAFDRSGVRMTLLGRGRAIELTGCPAG